MDLENLERDFQAQLEALTKQHHAREDKLLLDAKAEKDKLRESLSAEVGPGRARPGRALQSCAAALAHRLANLAAQLGRVWPWPLAPGPWPPAPGPWVQVLGLTAQTEALAVGSSLEWGGMCPVVVAVGSTAAFIECLRQQAGLVRTG
jgi:hypothetical protein